MDAERSERAREGEMLIGSERAREELGGVSGTTLKRLVRSGALPVVKIGRRTLFRQSTLAEFAERHETRRGPVDRGPDAGPPDGTSDVGAA